mmetsp:Transcript_2262/g.2949  ORF Transcript_2262/g.2949 Transcript_2262/m.2949 type:complete len:220 (+) Transcript_2262:144-803(+)
MFSDGKRAVAKEAILEAPIPRSILIQPPTAKNGLERAGHASTLGPLPPGLKSLTGLKSLSGAPQRARQEKPLKTQVHRWSIEDSSLTFISPHFPLERNHVVIRDSSPSDIAKRVALCLAGHHTAASYSSNEASAMVETDDGVKFKVSLFRESPDQPNGVLVECQRRRGDGFAFHKIARAVLRAAGGLEWKDNRCHHSFKVPESVLSGTGKQSRPSDPLP